MVNSLNITQVNSSSITIAGLATADEYEAVLQLIFYNNTSPNPVRASRTIVFMVTDNLMMSNFSDTAFTLVHIIPTYNYALLVFNASRNVTYMYNETSYPVFIFTGLTDIVDPDPMASLQWMTVTISNPSVGDVLAITATFPGLIVNVTATSLNISGSLNLTAYIKALQNVTYFNSDIALRNGQRTVAVVTFDGTVQSPEQNITIVYSDNPPICYFGNMVCEIVRVQGIMGEAHTGDPL